MDQFEIREDEEQLVKLQDTVELLVAAGYFRARIKGLHPFDKIVGGMVWCLETCNFDVDVDLMFQESLTIGQKIALTEKIVRVLPEMHCPYRLDPHQIQGLDFIHIFPVVQWLVKKSIEAREETGDVNRAFTIQKFENEHSLPEDVQAKEVLENTEQGIQRLNTVYAPKRKFRRKAGVTVPDDNAGVKYTLLEYGHQLPLGIFGDTSASQRFSPGGNSSDEKTDSRSPKSEPPNPEADMLRTMATEMEQLEEKTRKVKGSTVGGLISQQSAEIAEFDALYEQRKANMEGRLPHSDLQPEHVVEMLIRQIAQLKTQEDDLLRDRDTSEVRMEQLRNQKRDLKVRKESLDARDAQLPIGLAEDDDLTAISELLTEKQELGARIQSFKAECKKEAAQIRSEGVALKNKLENAAPEDKQLIGELEIRLEAEKDALNEVRLKLAQRNREIAQIQRRLDDAPPQAELSQYQKRFVELYDQMAAKLSETKKFYTLYNTLTDSKTCYEKEVQLLESIHDNYDKAMQSDSAKEQFLRQLDMVLESLKQTVARAEKKRSSEKLRRDHLNDSYVELLEKERTYHKLVKEFQQECARNEDLQGRSS
ncbi:hypothetical protein RvY_10090 [Ramazzottius varieornatus]|uniref:Coiled-coil domain-containing protein 93 n=1 Tax=Ramazzottius varieornatus TaxID=947166 RepID=A0A1D1VDQ1_RAMVA|nr:hypothetical protein RvY_10090 [Ramazzottius varieornatus]